MNASQLSAAKRKQNIIDQSVNPFGENYPTDLKSPKITRNIASYKEGDHKHHRAILEVYEPLFTGLSKQDQLVMVEELQSRGVLPGNNPLGITAMSAEDHLGEGRLHQTLRKKGLEILSNQERATGKFIADSGQAMSGGNQFFDKIRNSSLEQRLQALPDFIEYIQGGLDDEIRNLGYKVPSREAQAAIYRKEVDFENDKLRYAEQIKNLDRMVKEETKRRGVRPSKLNTNEYAGELLDTLLKSVVYAGRDINQSGNVVNAGGNILGNISF